MEKRLIRDFKIEESGTKLEEEEWKPSLSGDINDDDNSRFIIDGKVVQGFKSKDSSILGFIKNAFSKGYGKNVN